VLKSELSKEKETLDRLKNTQDNHQKDIFDLEKQIAILTIQADALKQESRRSETDERNREDELSIFNEKLQEITSQVEDLEDRLHVAQKHEIALIQSISDKKQSIDQLQEQNQQHSRLLDAKKNEHNLTKSMVDNLEGFPDSIRFLRK